MAPEGQEAECQEPSIDLLLRCRFLHQFLYGVRPILICVFSPRDAPPETETV